MLEIGERKYPSRKMSFLIGLAIGLDSFRV